jgi:hypothetical protein
MEGGWRGGMKITEILTCEKIEGKRGSEGGYE